MYKYFSYLVILFILCSCSSQKDLRYLHDIVKNNDKSWQKPNNDFKNLIQSGDILNINVSTTIPEASLIFNPLSQLNQANSLDLIKLNGYLVDNFGMINFPEIGKINSSKLSIFELSEKIKNLLINGGHLLNPIVNIRIVNSKFSVLGEVKSPGTFILNDEKINIFQALAYAGDITVDGKRKDIKLIRNFDGKSKVIKIDLTKSNIFSSEYLFIKNNDVIIVNASFSKVKSAGFIGNPSSIASLASILLSLTLLIINKN